MMKVEVVLQVKESVEQGSKLGYHAQLILMAPMQVLLLDSWQRSIKEHQTDV